MGSDQGLATLYTTLILATPGAHLSHTTKVKILFAFFWADPYFAFVLLMSILYLALEISVLRPLFVFRCLLIKF